MAAIEWDESLSVNVAEIDEQHQRFISIANELSDSLRQNKGSNFTGKIIDDLLDYAEVHFKTEEKYFEQFNYPDADNHKNEHGSFIDSVSAIKARLEGGEGVMSLEMVRFVSTWVLTHIRTSDKDYSRFLNDNGVR